MSHETDNPDAPLEEQLVAYLDGELDTESNRRIEELLAADPQVRASLQGLDRTWELLDELDTTTPAAEGLAQTTLEMVAVAAADEAEQVRCEAPRRRRRRLAAAGGGLLAASLAGFLAVALLRPDPNRQLLEDLPVLMNFDEYRQIDDLQFLRALHDERLFSEEDGHER